MLIGYNRPEYLIRRIQEIALNAPSKLFISLDGHTDKRVQSEVLKSVESAVIENLHSTEVELISRNKNYGLSLHIVTAITEVLAQIDRVVVIEDDIRIGANFLQNLKWASNNISSNQTVATVGGFSPISGKEDDARNAWRITRYFSAWGWSISADVWQHYRREISIKKELSSLENSAQWNSLSRFQQNVWLERFSKVEINPNLTWDYQMQFRSFAHDFSHVLPIRRICENEGFNDSRSTNTRNPRPRWMGKSAIHRTQINEKSTELSSKVLERLDSFTISGDSRMRKELNRLKNNANFGVK